MANKMFQHASKTECDLAKSNDHVGLCNLTSNKIEVTEEGHFIPPRGHAIIDKVNPIINSLASRGILAINETVVEETKTSRSKKKNEESGFKADAIDGDRDGMVQDGTEWERLAEEVPAKEKQNVSSETDKV
jgi:hypothetical protein